MNARQFCRIFFVNAAASEERRIRSWGGPGLPLAIIGHLRRGFAHFKLGTHFLDLGGLLFELECESLYLFLLLSDCCFQLLNFANFVIEHAGELGWRAGCATTLRRATLYRCATILAWAKIPAKVVVLKVQSNLNHGTANRLEVVEDTTDEALRRPGPVPVRDVADADRIAFVIGEGTNEIADVNVIEARDQVLSCRFTHGCVLTTINVVEERYSANCRVVIAQTERIRVIIPERVITNRGVCNSVNIEEKRVVAKSVVAVSVNVTNERTGAKSVVVPAKWETMCEKVIKQERVITHGRVAAGSKVIIERSITNGGVWIATSVELERLSANCRVVAGSPVIKLERLGTHGGFAVASNVMDKLVSSIGRVLWP